MQHRPKRRHWRSWNLFVIYGIPNILRFINHGLKTGQPCPPFQVSESNPAADLHNECHGGIQPPAEKGNEMQGGISVRWQSVENAVSPTMDINKKSALPIRNEPPFGIWNQSLHNFLSLSGDDPLESWNLYPGLPFGRSFFFNLSTGPTWNGLL